LLGPRADAAGLYGSGPLNIGYPDDYRVPDQAYLRTPGVDMYRPSAALVVEIVSPGDETLRKLDFYHRAGVEELLIVDPEAHTVEWFERAADRFVPTDHSQLLGLSAPELDAAITWPD
jgi:Uma2 family endonuclease